MAESYCFYTKALSYLPVKVYYEDSQQA